MESGSGRLERPRWADSVSRCKNYKGICVTKRKTRTFARNLHHAEDWDASKCSHALRLLY